MLYEQEYDRPKINYHFLVIIGIAVLITAILFYPVVKQEIAKSNVKPVTTPNISKVVEIQYVTILVTPTPDGKNYFANEYENGIRKLKRPFSFVRYDVAGKMDLSVHATVYDYKVFNMYHWFNPQDYKYYPEYPIDGYKFVFVFVNLHMDNIIGNDVRIWFPNESHYALQVGNTLYQPISFQKQLRIKELEYTYNMNDDTRIPYYGTTRIYSSSSQYAPTAGETYLEQNFLYGGKSNAVDGYIVYEVPLDAKEDDMIIDADFYSFGTASWKLKV